MKLVPLSSLFEVRYGVNLELNRMTLDPVGVPFVGRSSRNNGITARVKRLPDVEPLEAGTLTVAGGGSVLETFVQPEPYYSGRDLYYLTSKVPMTLNQKLYYCVCIKSNKYRYNYGRQANKTLKNILIPDIESVPDWVGESNPAMFDKSDVPAEEDEPSDLFSVVWKYFQLDSLFDLKKGKHLTKANMKPGAIPFVGAIDSNNGVAAFVNSAIHEGNTITVVYNGAGVAEPFTSPLPFGHPMMSMFSILVSN